MYDASSATHGLWPGWRPTIVCLCGSTRFHEAFHAANFRETMAGKIVLTIGNEHCSDEDCRVTEEEKAALDKLHLAKVALADEVLILNVGGYIGSSTRNELEHARRLGKVVRFLESESGTSGRAQSGQERNG